MKMEHWHHWRYKGKPAYPVWKEMANKVLTCDCGATFNPPDDGPQFDLSGHNRGIINEAPSNV